MFKVMWKPPLTLLPSGIMYHICMWLLAMAMEWLDDIVTIFFTEWPDKVQCEHAEVYSTLKCR